MTIHNCKDDMTSAIIGFSSYQKVVRKKCYCATQSGLPTTEISQPGDALSILIYNGSTSHLRLLSLPPWYQAWHLTPTSTSRESDWNMRQKKFHSAVWSSKNVNPLTTLQYEWSSEIPNTTPPRRHCARWCHKIGSTQCISPNRASSGKQAWAFALMNLKLAKAERCTWAGQYSK